MDVLGVGFNPTLFLTAVLNNDGRIAISEMAKEWIEDYETDIFE